MESLKKASGNARDKLIIFHKFLIKVLALCSNDNQLLDKVKRLEIGERLDRLREVYDRYDKIQTDIDELSNDEEKTI